ncbi:penicillin-binding protein 1A [Noviherbaspirillum humi]|uniref:Penicillin-binding protein 1A n=1 Tax=Noviherbaspirillum humi TaxID=1688639 RepID=A0A239IDK1_9BURK|nr:penicillin-binding protein 1A [Noviherbaspirillum humi]
MLARAAGLFRTLTAPGISPRVRLFAAGKAGALLGAAGFVLLLLWTILLIPLTPSATDLKKAKAEQPSMLISADGKWLASYKRFNRDWVPLDQVSPHVVAALIATEDHRFYEHHGIDFYRLGGAVLHTLAGRTEGGSTITQQLARNLYPEEIGRQRSLSRKLKEAITALKIERAYTKREILETYLNTVPFLYNAFGIEMAARTYFDKPAARLNVLESATLIGMLKGTSYYNPVTNIKRATERRNAVLGQMARRGVLTEAALEAMKKKPIVLDFERLQEERGIAPHFAEHIRKWLVEWADRHDYNIYTDGLRVRTTIDSRLQAMANQALARQTEALQAVADVEWGMRGDRLLSTSAAAYAGMRQRVRPFGHLWSERPDLVDAFIRESGAWRNLVAGGMDGGEALAKLRGDAEFMDKLRRDKTRLEAGFIALDPKTGEVRAWVGSRAFDSGQFDHVARAQRQPGSTFKPFVYGAALEQGMTPDRTFIDEVRDFRMRDGTIWRPTDITPATGKPMTLAEGLMYSKNTITAQVMQVIGPNIAADFARRSGVRQSRLNPVPALALGTSPVSLAEMATAYGTIANGGEYRKPVLVTRVEDKDGNTLVEFGGESDRVMGRGVAEDLTGMLRGVVNRGTGQAIRSQFGIGADVAGKTGTTQDNTDGWFILMHPRLVAGAWVGFDDPRITMRSSYWGQGAHNALPIVGDFFRRAQSSRMIDTQARFPRARDALPGASIWGPVLDWFENLFGGPSPTAPPKPAAKPAPAPSQQPRKEGGPLDAIDQVLRDVRNAQDDIERQWHWVQNAIDGLRKLF